MSNMYVLDNRGNIPVLIWALELDQEIAGPNHL